MADEFETDLIRSLRDLALSFPGVTEGESCVNRAFRAGTKGFLYLGEKDGTWREAAGAARAVESRPGRGPRHLRDSESPDHWSAP